MEQKILITINAYGITHSAEISDESTAFELMEICAMLAESIGFSPSLVVKGLECAIDSRV